MTDEKTTTFLTTEKILRAVDLEWAYAVQISNLCNARGLTQNDEGVEFVHSKYDELTEYMNANCDSTVTLPEIKVVIQEWLTKQVPEVVKE